MNRIFLVSGGLFLVLAGLVGADYLSTSIVTDGSFVLASSGQKGFFSSITIGKKISGNGTLFSWFLTD